jgi:hypothetical protein
MITFTQPENLNGAELRAELNAVGVAISDNAEAVSIDENGALILDIDETKKDLALKIVAAHNGTTAAPDLTVKQKLASVGLSIDDLKAALGL